jgi:hypothetical protein
LSFVSVRPRTFSVRLPVKSSSIVSYLSVDFDVRDDPARSLAAQQYARQTSSSPQKSALCTLTTDKKVTEGNCTVRHIALDSFRIMSQLVLAVDRKVTRGLATAFRASLPSRVSVTRKQTLPSFLSLCPVCRRGGVRYATTRHQSKYRPHQKTAGV